MDAMRDLFVQTETFVLFFACIIVKNRLPVPLPLERGVYRFLNPKEFMEREAMLQNP